MDAPPGHRRIEGIKRRKNGAGEETRTLDIHLGKVTLYQLSYARSRKAGAKIHSGRPQRKTFVHRIERAYSELSARAAKQRLSHHQINSSTA
jgi:hypothetical protein